METATEVGGMHPPGIHSCLGSIHSRRHAWQGSMWFGGHACQGAYVVGACMAGGVHGRRDGH